MPPLGRKKKIADQRFTGLEYDIIYVTHMETIQILLQVEKKYKTRRAVAIATVCIPFPVCLSRASLTFYSTSMVTMALSASVSKLQPAEICLTSF